MQSAERALLAEAEADAARRRARDARVALPGATLAYTVAGQGEPVLLVHGLGGSRRTWHRVIDTLAQHYTVIAPDLPGHGESEAPAGDYSLGAHATALRDLLFVLGHPRATIVGHSLGGGIAMQFSYQFPERTSRLVLISSGGLGDELSPMLRAVTLPGAQHVIAGLGMLPVVVTRSLLPQLSRVPGLLARSDAGPLADSLRELSGARQRQAFVSTANAVISWRGQRVSATRQLAFLAELPVLVAWGSNDQTIPPSHHQSVARYLPESHVVEVPGAGHFPHETDPEKLLPALTSFLSTTECFVFDEDRWRILLSPRPDGTVEPAPGEL